MVQMQRHKYDKYERESRDSKETIFISKIAGSEFKSQTVEYKLLHNESSYWIKTLRGIYMYISVLMKFY